MSLLTPDPLAVGPTPQRSTMSSFETTPTPCRRFLTEESPTKTGAVLSTSALISPIRPTILCASSGGMSRTTPPMRQ